jgi:hypothetical protein
VSHRDDLEPSFRGGASPGVRRLLSRRLVWHTAGLLVALVLAWLVFQAYRQPEFMLELSTLRLC